jgi:hypothetical protein
MYATNALFVLDALDRPQAHRAQNSIAPRFVPEIAPQIFGDFGPTGEVYVCVDPDDRIQEGREGNNVASRKERFRSLDASRAALSQLVQRRAGLDRLASRARLALRATIFCGGRSTIGESRASITSIESVSRRGKSSDEVERARRRRRRVFSPRALTKESESLRLAANGAGRAHADLPERDRRSAG